MQCTCGALAARSAWAVLTALALTLVPVAVAPASGPPSGATRPLLLPSAGWQGRAIQEPHRHEAVRTSVAGGPLRGWSAGAVSYGTGYRRSGGSVRVREVQRRLRRLGYRPGEVDGLFGPLTRASVAWFQVKHGIPVDGRATLATVRHLRARTGAGGSRGQARDAQRSTGIAPAAESASDPWATFRQLVGPRPQAAIETSSGEESPLGLIALLAVVALASMLIGAAVLKRIAAAKAPTDAAPGTTVPRQARALAYVLVPPGMRDDASFQAHAAAMETACTEHGLTLAGLMLDVENPRLDGQRPGLAAAVRRLVAGEVEFLMVSRLDEPARAGVRSHQLVGARGADGPDRSSLRVSSGRPRDERELSDE